MSGADRNDAPADRNDLPADGTRPSERTTDVEVVRGGQLSDIEVAALTVALTPSDADASPAAIPAWRLAGLYEGVGGATALDAPDLAHLTRRR